MSTEDEESQLDAACRFLFRKLILGLFREMKKAKTKITESFSYLVYKEIRSVRAVTDAFISKLPQSLQKGRLAAAFVIEIITDTFSWVFKEALGHLSRELRDMRPPVMTATIHPVTSISDKDEENSEVQRFFGWAVKDLLDKWKRKLKKAIDNDAPLKQISELEAIVNFVKNMILLHGEALADEAYMANFYPVWRCGMIRTWR
jgi:hypothetical protein